MRTLSDDWSGITYTSKRIYLPELEESISDAHVDSIKLTEAISDTDTLFYVGCISSKVDIALNNFTTNIEGKKVEIYIQKADTEEIKVFTGTIISATMDGANKTVKAVAYDSLFEIFNTDVAEWYDGLTLPMTLKNFRDAFFNHFNITQKTQTLINDSFLIQRTVGGEEILGRDIIKPLCEANCVFGHINYDGVMEYISLTDSTKTVLLSEVSAMTKEDYVTSYIDKVIIREDEEDIGQVAGVGSNAYIIEDNMYFLGLSSEELTTIANTILTNLSSYSYRPITCDDMYNPQYELGDKIVVPDGFGGIYTSYILERTTDFIRESVQAKGVQDYSKSASYSNDSLIKLRGKTNRLFRSVEETRSTITDVEQGLQTEIRQTAEGIEAQIQDLQDQIDGVIDYYTRETGEPTLLNYPYWDFCTNIPCNNTVQTTDDLHFIYTEQNRIDHLRDLTFVEDTAVSYRFSRDGNNWFWNPIADSETSYILSQIAELRATAENLQSEYTQLSLDLSQDYPTKVEMNSAISQSASQIQTTVSQTYATKTTTNDLQTQITQQAGLIEAKAEREGGDASTFSYELTASRFVLKANNSTVFKCDQNGITTIGTTSATHIEGASAEFITCDTRFLKINGKSYSPSTINVASTYSYAFASNITNYLRYSSAAGGYVFSSLPTTMTSFKPVTFGSGAKMLVSYE